MILYLITIILPLFIHHDNIWKPAIISYYKIETSHDFIDDFGYYIYFLTAPLILVLFACFHDNAPRSQKIFSLVALSLIISSTVLRTLAFLEQIEINHFNIHACKDDCLLYQFCTVLSNSVFSVYMVSITIFIGLAELLLIPVFTNKTRIEKNLKIVFLISGIMNLLSALPLKTYTGDRSAVFFILSQLFMIIVMAFSMKFFRQIKTKENEE
jgi:hypothetical protein